MLDKIKEAKKFIEQICKRTNEVNTGARAKNALELLDSVLKQDTPSSKWHAEGKEDPHKNQYDCERAALTLGDFTDDELANEVFMFPNIGNLIAAKERIRWLSRQLEKKEA